MKYQKITEVLKNSKQNNPETVPNQNNKDIPEGRYISPKTNTKNY